MVSGTYVTTIRGQHTEQDAIDVAKRELAAVHLRFVKVIRTFRGSQVGSWVVELQVERETRA
jgi:hypothetical protein